MLDVRNAGAEEEEVAHGDSTSVWWLVRPRELKEATDGGFLELISEFALPPDGEVAPHSHPTHEWYYVLQGMGTMRIGAEERRVRTADLIYIPPRETHSLSAGDGSGIRCFCFAIAEPGAPMIDYGV